LLWTALAPLPTVVFSLDGTLSRLDGALLVAWFGVALLGVARSGRDVLTSEPPTRQRFSAARLLGGLGLLTIGGDLLGDSLRRVVTGLGVSATLLGNTAIAAGVEAEELARVAVPTRRGKPELALANIAGTIVHFISLNAGVIALVKPVPLDRATRELHMPVAAGATLVLCGLLATRRRLGRLEGGALAVLYVLYVGAAIALG
jgi:cation:H+ antiporter